MICILSADVFSRFQRSLGNDVLFVCGTDDHGTTAETKALEEGLTPQELTDKYFKIHKEIYEWIGCSFDCFGRTSSESNHKISIDIFTKLDKNGYIKNDTIEQLYCEKCDKFLADRFVEGTCPHCGYEEARGDQCEKCGNLLDATDLKQPRCKVCQGTPIVKETEHLFIDLPKLKPELDSWMDGVKDRWSNNARTMTESWMCDGLKLRAITRDLKWGIKVPGYDKVFYSWFDAPIGYIGITIENMKDWESWWKSTDVRLVQFMGKDNIPFHTILFPGFLIGSKDSYTLLSDLSVNEYINYEGGMFSKSRGIGVFGDNARDSGIPADVWRYYLLINRPEKSDTEFTWKDFQEKLNNELVANIGNLVNRTMTFINRFFDNTVPENSGFKERETSAIDELKESYKKLTKDLENRKIKDGLKNIMHMSRIANQYFQEAQPWKHVEDGDAAVSLAFLANIVKDLAIVLEPFMPHTSEEIFKMLNIDAQRWNSFMDLSVKGGHKIAGAKHLFSKLDDIKPYLDKYKGKQEVDHFDKLDLRVAEIKAAEDHPNADSLLVLKIDIGESRQIVAGLRKFYSKEELIGKKIVVVSNLKPAVIREVESNGMLLAAEKGKKDKLKVKLLEAKDGKPGERVLTKDREAKDKKQVTYDVFAKVHMHIKDDQALIGDSVLITESGITVICQDMAGSKVR